AQASLTAGLAEGQRRQWVRDDERADDMARLLPAVVDGLQTQWLLDPSVDMPALVETFLRLCTKQRESASDSEQGPAG
ncbi:MAG TPA: TetR family transcriptional regulator C-terminal domain-containing protein, partial [Yinghuangia sp.]|nr:TetR family transcriptional regulator C-terminal domain-containing protein [Yinghuangia sp.]